MSVHAGRTQTAGVAAIAILLSLPFSPLPKIFSIVAACALGFLVYYFGSKWLGDAIKFVVETADNAVLGVEIEVGALSVSMVGARVKIKDCIVKNPVVDPPFKSDYLLNIGQVVFDINITRLITSLVKGMVAGFKESNIEFEIEEIAMKDIDSIIEYKGMVAGFGESNINDVLENLMGSAEGKKVEPQKEEPKDDKPSLTHEVIEIAKDIQIILKKVEIKDIGMKLQTNLCGTRVSAGDILIDDFSKGNTSRKASQIIYLLLKSILKTLMENAVGKNFTERFL